MIKVRLEKVYNEIWYRHYAIYARDDSLISEGFVYKCKKNSLWTVYITDCITPTKWNDEYKTLKEAKKAIIEALTLKYYG